MSIQVIKQFMFQEDVWELIKEFLITNRSKLLLKTRILSINTLTDILKRHFRKRVVNIRTSSIPLELRKNVVVKEIAKRCEESPEKYAEITRELLPKDCGWFSDFRVGQDVFIVMYFPKKKASYTRKGIIRSIGKTIRVELYGVAYTEYGMLVLNTFDGRVSITDRSRIRTR
jgi:hypothetical protein